MDIDLISGRRTTELFGTAKYSREVFSRLEGVNFHHIEYPLPFQSSLMDGAIRRMLYPLIVKSRVRPSVIKHIANQNLAFLADLIHLSPLVVTCYDMIPWSYSHNRSMYWKMNLEGLKKADRIITISEFSKKEIIKYTGIEPDRIRLVNPGVDRSRYFPAFDRGILSRYGFQSDDRIILYVGSEEPRKNLSLLLKAMNELKSSGFPVKLLKVGIPQFGGDRKLLIDTINGLDLQKDVIFAENVPETDLPLFYNAADVFVFPSVYEGFGLPPLEAMACGCPVIAANATSIPEVVGDAGILIDPMDESGLADAIRNAIINQNLRKKLIHDGLVKSQSFSWWKAAKETEEVYREMHSGLSTFSKSNPNLNNI